MLVEWPPTADHPYNIYDVYPRTAIKDGTLRALPMNMLIGEVTEVQYHFGKYAEGRILVTGILQVEYFLMPRLPTTFSLLGTKEAMQQRQLIEEAKLDAKADEALKNKGSDKGLNNMS